MVCRSCANEERASEGYPCITCGTFICIMCTFKGVVQCKQCAAQHPAAVETVSRNSGQVPIMDWPEH